MHKADKRQCCIITTEAMIKAQEMMERAETRRDLKIAEAVFQLAYTLELLLKDPSVKE